MHTAGRRAQPAAWGGAACRRTQACSSQPAPLVLSSSPRCQAGTPAPAVTCWVPASPGRWALPPRRRLCRYQGTVVGPDGKLLPGPWKSVGQRQRTHKVERRPDGIYVQVGDVEGEPRGCGSRRGDAALLLPSSLTCYFRPACQSGPLPPTCPSLHCRPLLRPSSGVSVCLLLAPPAAQPSGVPGQR